MQYYTITQYNNYSIYIQRIHPRLIEDGDFFARMLKKDHVERLSNLFELLIDEGFDFPQPDSLVMATPAAGRSFVEHNARRWLNQDFSGKKERDRVR